VFIVVNLTTIAAMRPHSRLEDIQVTAADTRYRLPKNVRPNLYNVYLKPEFQTFKFEDDVKIMVKVNKSEAIVDHEKHFLIKNNPSNVSADTEHNSFVSETR
jgi:hypothetical protein